MSTITRAFIPPWLFNAADLLPWLSGLTARFEYGGGASAAPSMWAGGDVADFSPSQTLDNYFHSNLYSSAPALQYTPAQLVGAAIANMSGVPNASSWAPSSPITPTQVFYPAGGATVPAAPSGADTLWLLFTDSSGSVKAYMPVWLDNVSPSVTSFPNDYLRLAHVSRALWNSAPSNVDMLFTFSLANSTDLASVGWHTNAVQYAWGVHTFGWVDALPDSASAALVTKLLGATEADVYSSDYDPVAIANTSPPAPTPINYNGTRTVSFPEMVPVTQDVTAATTAIHNSTPSLPQYLGVKLDTTPIGFSVQAPQLQNATVSNLPVKYTIPNNALRVFAGYGNYGLCYSELTLDSQAPTVPGASWPLAGTAPAAQMAAAFAVPLTVAAQTPDATAALTLQAGMFIGLAGAAPVAQASLMSADTALTGVAPGATMNAQLQVVAQIALAGTAPGPRASVSLLNGTAAALTATVATPSAALSLTPGSAMGLVAQAPATVASLLLGTGASLDLEIVAQAPLAALTMARVASMALAATAPQAQAQGLLVTAGSDVVYAMLAETHAVAQMHSSPYREIAQHGATIYALTAAGLVKVGADTDAGVPVIGSLTSYFTALAGGRQVRLESVYLNGRIEAGTLTVNAEVNKAAASYTYTFAAARPGLWQQRVPVGRGLRADRVALTVTLTGPSALNSIELPVVESSRRM